MDVLLAPCVVSPAESAVANRVEGLGGEVLLRAWTDAAPHDRVDLCELSAGGAGFATLVGHRAETVQRGRDPRVASSVARPAPGVVLVGGTAYVDSSLVLQGEHGSAGVGEQLLAALGAGASRIVLGLAGPDTRVVPDAGLGLLATLGVAGLRGRALLDSGLLAGPGDDSSAITADDLAGLSGALGLFERVDLVGACADDLPLLGLHGTSAGAGEAGALTPAGAQRLERAVGQVAHAVWSAVTTARRPDLLSVGSAPVPGRPRDVTGLPGAGAGGGIGWIVVLAGGRLLPGAAVYADAVDLRARAAAADLVVTTADHLDASTFHGSGAEQAVSAAAEVGVPAVVVARTSMMSRRESSSAGISAVYVASERPRADVDDPPAGLGEVVCRVARSWSPARTAGR